MTAEEIRKLNIENLIETRSFDCSCGRTHSTKVKKVLVEKGAVQQLPALLREFGVKRPFLLSGHDSFEAAGGAVCRVLENAGMSFSCYVFPHSPVEPTEYAVGSALMHFDYRCDAIIAVGSGVINDTGKMLARATGMKYIVFATAPSMDGFLSATSSMDRDGLKTTIDSTAPLAVVGDLDILCQAPMHLLLAGVGDMLAKIISLKEWEMAGIIVGEYYCPVIAALVEKALTQVTEKTDGLLKRDPEAVKAVTEGLLIAGLAMSYAGLSRPASGMEHYFSHIWDMRSLAFEDAKSDNHGIQTGIGTLYSLMAYECFLHVCHKPDFEKAEAYVKQFQPDAWNDELRHFVGPGAEAMIEAEKREHKYDPERHRERFGRISEHWEEIQNIIRTLPSSESVRRMMEEIGFPTSAAEIGYGEEEVRLTFMMTKDIRDKYVGSRLFWDLGVLEEIADAAFREKKEL